MADSIRKRREEGYCSTHESSFPAPRNEHRQTNTRTDRKQTDHRYYHRQNTNRNEGASARIETPEEGLDRTQTEHRREYRQNNRSERTRAQKAPFCHYFNNNKECPYDSRCRFRHEQSRECSKGNYCQRYLCQFRHLPQMNHFLYQGGNQWFGGGTDASPPVLNDKQTSTLGSMSAPMEPLHHPITLDPHYPPSQPMFGASRRNFPITYPTTTFNCQVPYQLHQSPKHSLVSTLMMGTNGRKQGED